MNSLNYGSLEACKRLVDNGIVLETDAVWAAFRNDEVDEVGILHWYLVMKSEREFAFVYAPDIPAPSMAEVWRELPTQGCYLTANQGYYHAWIEWTDFEGHGKSYEAKEYTNPTGALISLLIWVRKEASNDHT